MHKLQNLINVWERSALSLCDAEKLINLLLAERQKTQSEIERLRAELKEQADFWSHYMVINESAQWKMSTEAETRINRMILLSAGTEPTSEATQ